VYIIPDFFGYELDGDNCISCATSPETNSYNHNSCIGVPEPKVTVIQSSEDSTHSRTKSRGTISGLRIGNSSHESITTFS
jgi:hypothetical protein